MEFAIHITITVWYIFFVFILYIRNWLDYEKRMYHNRLNSYLKMVKSVILYDIVHY